MSTVVSDPGLTLSAKPEKNFSLPAWAHEPLLHFIVLGGLLFAVDYVIASREDDPRTIVIDASVDADAIRIFKDSRGREPNEDELYALRRVWLDNEVLYREGLAMQLDRGDKAIRERVIFKALSVIDTGTKLPVIDEKVLRGYFEKNRAKYDEPARFSFQEAVLEGGNRTESDLRAFAQALNDGAPPDDVSAGLRVFNARPHSNVVQSYGEEFAKELEAATPGEWRVLRGKDGLRVMQLESVTPAEPADFESLKGVVLQDWTDATLADQRTAAVRALAQKYTVKVESATP